jgi:hypothetical protein
MWTGPFIFNKSNSNVRKKNLSTDHSRTDDRKREKYFIYLLYLEGGGLRWGDIFINNFYCLNKADLV